MPYLFLCKGKLIYRVTHVTEIKPLTVLILTSSVKNENRKIMNTIIIVLFTRRRHFLFFLKWISRSLTSAKTAYASSYSPIWWSGYGYPLKDPSLGWVARIEVVRDTPYASQVIQVKNNRETRLGHTELE